ncbi:protein of unknown function [Actinopolymorpha cephalotaxi]|uniref:HNH nuclease domain-containing protein n=1 Tax=Actinopolymorpha cephalotaxi TaxID=504797 RepID=A0A1I2PEA3_9ACTN|nr:DUF222 domain-containing protein [Actinopolymorpha cephalotaxi]NYH83642.1 hypothetical protein [Actinopolymorpha cephalotaxi]SFG14428.1 protein of unknown function [Actinopolymorpha cephalotaxi]
MSSTTQDPPGWDGGIDAEQRLEAALATIRAGVDQAMSTPATFLQATKLGSLIGELLIEQSRCDALKLGWVRQADACDIGKTTGAATTAAWLRNGQRMGKNDSYATVALARDLDRTITLTARALARGELSFRHAQVIAGAIKDLPKWVSLEQRAAAEEYLIDESRRRNPDDVRILGRHLLQVIAPQEWEERLSKELDAAERAAERSRSLFYRPNGVPGSETVVIRLPVLEMEQLRKIIEALVAADKRAEPDDRPLDQRRGDAFANLVTSMAEWEASPNRGRGRDCVTVLIHLQQLMNGVGFGSIDDLNPVRPMPCGCQTADAKRQAQRQATKRKARKNAKRSETSESGESGSGASRGGTTDAEPSQSASDSDSTKPDKAENTKPGKTPDGTEAATSEDDEPSSNGEHRADAKASENADDTGPEALPSQGITDPDDASGPSDPTEPAGAAALGDPDVVRDPVQPGDPAGAGDPEANSDLKRGARPTATSGPQAAPAAAQTTAATSESQPDTEKPPPDPTAPAGAAERVPAPREPGEPPQPNTATGTEPGPGTEPEAEPGPRRDPEPEPHNGNPEPHTGPEDWNLGAEDDDAEPEEGAAGPEAAFDPHDGCSKCGGGGSARITGLRGEPVSVATIRRMACDANIIPVVLGGNGEVLDVGMADRFFTEAQRRALAVRDGSHCHFPDCQVPERRCVAHHMTAWDDFGPTDLDNGVLLCKSHHTFVHHKGWQVRMGSHGHPEYIPPEWVDVHQKVQRP